MPAAPEPVDTTVVAPPVAPRRPRSLVAHGDERVDDWYWLRSDTLRTEGRGDPEVVAHLEAENEFTRASLAPLTELQDGLFEEIRGRIQETDLSVPYRKDDWWYYSRTVEGQQYEVSCRRHGSLEAPEQVVLDENQVAGDADYFAVGAFDVSPDHRLLLYSTDISGAELYTLRVRDLATGTDRADEVSGTYYGTAWASDNRTFFYVRPDAAMRPYQVWRHTLGTAATDDVLVFEEADERFFVSVWRAKSGGYVFVDSSSKMTSETWMLPAHDPVGALRVVAPREHGHEYTVTHAPSEAKGDRLLIVTNRDGAVNFKLVEAPVDDPGPEGWVEVEPHRPEVKLEAVDASAHHVALFERAEGLRRIRVSSLTDGTTHTIDMPEAVYAAGDGGNPEYDTDTLRFSYTSLVTPRSVFDYDMVTRQRTLMKETPVLGGYDRTTYETTRLWATAADGARVPISVVHRRGMALDGSNPCLLYGYGSYEHSVDPVFSSLRLSLLERGFVFAIAHVRGGGEMGRPWYEDGRLLHKRNTFDDFVACAQHLVAAGYTAPSRLVARGGSAGGLLMGAVTNLRPDLFAAVVAEVPFVDCLTTILDETLPLTVTEWEEWGNPVADPDVYAYMKTYSPYDNVVEAAYPAVLATAGVNDPRVSYWEPAKWVQKLRTCTTSGQPVYLKTEMGAGHGGPSGRYDAWRDEAFVYSFVLDAVDLAR